MPPFQFPAFPYDPLPTPTSIRLLTVRSPVLKEAPTIGGHKLLLCRLVTVNLDEKPSYNALSYTWGDPNPLDRQPSYTHGPYATHNQWPISLNGQLFFVTKNLYDGLCQLKADEWLEDSEVDARFEPYNKTRLIEAAEEGRYDDVEDCLRHGAYIGSVDCFGMTGLHYASENGHADIVELLLANNADPTATDENNWTPLDKCLDRKRRQYARVVEMLNNFDVAAMKAVSPRVRHHRSKPIWIDAICVNQVDVLERNAQVAMMTRIYGQAQSVIMWLGAFETEATYDLYHEMPTILNSSSECFRRSWEAWHRRKKTGESDEDDEDVKNGTILSTKKMETVLEFVRRSYFQRIWVLQEVALARNVRIMFAGDDLPWSSLFQVFQSAIDFEFVGTDYNIKLVKYRYGDMGTLAWSLADVRLHTRRTELEDDIVTTHLEALHKADPEFVAMGDSWWRSKLPLPTLIALTWNFAATDPRDKIFALLGIARTVSGEAPMVADYNRSITDVYTEVGKTFIQAKGDNRYQDWRSGEIEDFEPLEALSFIQDLGAIHGGWCWLRPYADKQILSPRPHDLPSWVPSFHWPLATRRLFSSRFRAAGETKVHIYPFTSDVLVLDGLCVDTLTTLEEQRHSDVDCYCGTANVLGWLRAMAAVDPVYPTGCDRVEALWQVLSANCYLKRAFPLTVYSWAEDPVGEDFADYIRDTLPDEIVNRHLCDEEGVVHLETLRWLRQVFGQDSSGALPDIEDILSRVKTLKKGEGEEEGGEEDAQQAEEGNNDSKEKEDQEQNEQAKAEEQDTQPDTATEPGSDPPSPMDSFEEIHYSDSEQDQPPRADSPKSDEREPKNDEAKAREPEDHAEEAAEEDKEDGGAKEGDNKNDDNESDDGGHANSFDYFMWCVWPLRRVAATKSGHLGLVPRTAQPGDQVWLFAGGRTPYILRPTDSPGQYSFVGEAYVHGIMDGEAAAGKLDRFGPVNII